MKSASSNDILGLPEFDDGEKIDNKCRNLSDEERWLIGFSVNQGSQRPKYTAGRMNFNYWKVDKRRIARDLYKIKHWKFVLGEYNSICNIKATWFIDPPYQSQHLYVHNDIDYDELKDWCNERVGQTIVCENSKATWLNFSSLTSLHGQRTTTTEVIWTNQ